MEIEQEQAQVEKEFKDKQLGALQFKQQEESQESLADIYLRSLFGPFFKDIEIPPVYKKDAVISLKCIEDAVCCAIENKIVDYWKKCRSCPKRTTETEDYVVCS
jgi:hypothetical protein